MKIEVPVGYSAKVVGRGKRNPVVTNFFEWISIEFPEHSDATAPVAVEWKDRIPAFDEGMQPSHVHDLKRFGLVPRDGLLHTRFVNGNHYWFNVLPETDDAESPCYKETVAQFQTRLRNNSCWPLKVERAAHWTFSEHPDGFPLDLDAYRTVEENTRDKNVQAAIDEVSEKLIAVNGYIYMKRAEPVYMVWKGIDLPNNDWQLWLKIVPNDEEGLMADHHKSRKDIFRIDQYEDANAVALDYGTKNGLPADRPSINDERRAAVLIGSTITMDTDSQVMFEIAKKIVDRMADHKMSFFSRDEAISYVNLRDAVQAFETTKDIGAIFEATVAYRDSLRAGGYSSIYKGDFDMIIERQMMKPLGV